MKQRLIRASIVAGAALIGGTCYGAYARASVARIHHTCDAGLQQTYHLAYVSADAVSPSSVFGSKHHDGRSDRSVNVQFSSDLIATTAACDARGSNVIWNLTQPSITLHGTGSDVGFSRMLERDLSHPFVLAVSANGSVTLVGKDQAASELGRNLVRRIAGAMQVTTPERSTLGALAWQTTEPDVSGDRTSAYTLSPWISGPFSSASVAFHRKTESAVTTTAATRFEGSSTFSSDTASDGRFGLDGSLQSIESNGFDTTIAQANVIARNAVAMRIERTRVTRVPDDTQSALAHYARRVLADATPLHVASDPRAVRRGIFITALGKSTTTSLEKSVADLRGRAFDPAVAGKADKLAGLFYLHPDVIARFEPELYRDDANSAAFIAVVQGLNRARSLGAQEALARALVAEAANERGSRIASELGFQPDPLPIVAGALDRVAAGATTASESAELALGSVAFTLLPTDPSLARGVAQRIAARFLSPAYAYRRRSEMLALGNSGNPAVLDLVMRTTQDHDPFLRSAATLALRRQTGTTAEERLRASLGGEDSAVRLSAAIAYTQRPVDANAYAALETAFRYETSPTVRSKELEAILDARDRQPDAIAFVEDVAAHDRDKDVRRNAKRALAGLPPPPPDNEAALASVETQTH